jgi:hypothetical protein
MKNFEEFRRPDPHSDAKQKLTSWASTCHPAVENYELHMKIKKKLNGINEGFKNIIFKKRL